MAGAGSNNVKTGGFGPAPGEKPLDLQYTTQGFPNPGSPGFGDAIPGALPAIRARNTAAAEAREMVGDSKPAIVLSEGVAAGVRRGLRTAGGQSVDPNLLDGNTRGRPVNFNGKFVILPQNATAAQIAAGALLAQANFAPGAYPAFPYTDDYDEDYQTGIIPGTGTTIQVPIRPSEVLVIDTLGITTFSQAAEFELVWLLTFGEVLGGSSVPNAANLMIQSRRGWPFGDVERPAKLYGRSRLAPQMGPTRSGETSASLVVQFRAATSPGPYVPQPHYVEIAVRGWLCQIGADGLVMGTNVGGPVMDANGSY